MEHIEIFEKVYSFTRANGVPPDYIRCMLFPFSLDGKDARWLNSLPTGSLTSWEQVRSAFLIHFYSKARTAALRNKITSFRQLTNERFCDAWERFNDYRRECLHHGFDDDYLLNIFYDGVDWKYQGAINSASNGDFMTQTTGRAFKLIKNMPASSANKKEESDCSKKWNNSDTQKIDELTAKVDQLLKNNKGHVFSMEQAMTGQIQNQNQQQPQRNWQAVQATGNNQPDELKGLGMMMQQMLQGQQVQAKVLNQVTTKMDTRMGNMFTELNNKYDTLAIHIRKIDVQLAQTAESVKRQQETLPGKTDKNPRIEHCNAIEQPFLETLPSAEERAEQPTSSAVTAPDESAETPPSRVYVPKVPYPIPPRHLMDPISEE
ncbi:hypothetical protein YC2023_089055 [Brassica napus]